MEQKKYSFKQGRGLKMLELLKMKENNININNMILDSTGNCSMDIIEGTPTPPSLARNVSSDSDDDEQNNISELSNILVDVTENDVSPSLLISCKQLHEIITSNNCEQSVTSIVNDNNPNSDVLEDEPFNSDDSVAVPNWQNPEDKTIKNIESEINTDISNESDIGEPQMKLPKKIKTTRWHKKKEDTYDRNIQKKNRSQCLPYKNYKKQIQPPKAPKPVNCKCRLNCSFFTDGDRIQICKSFWALTDYTRQKGFILRNVTLNTPKRRLVNAARYRTVTRSYYFSKDEQKIRVCEKFFKNTLCISNGPINKAFSKVGSSGIFEGQDRRGKHEAHNKTKQEDVDFVKEHIEAFPTMESHYCRKTSSKKYLDSTLSIPKMYELYEEKCRSASKSPVSVNVYRNIFCTQYNLDFHKPKKDQCLLCHKYKCAKTQNSADLTTWQQKYEEQITLKEQSREAKELDKIRANEDESFNSITLDLQKVLHLPTSNVSLLYYLRKLNVYNATIYEARSPNDGFCYLWSEIDGKKGSDEVGTALYLWIKRLPSTVTEISIFSDTCGGQNRNQFLLCLQLYLVQTTHLEVIEHKYLESGHTHMEVDSMHSAIENQMRLMPIFSMIDLCNIIKLARSNRKTKKNAATKKPYEPIVMNYKDILDLKDLRKNLMVNRSIGSDGEKVQWLKVKYFSAISRADVPARPVIGNLNSLLADIHVRYIALKREDFQRHYRVFQEVFHQLNENMKAVDKYYERYVSNIQFAGSHYDRLRINKPDEFDMDIVIRAPVNMDSNFSNLAQSDIVIEKNRPEYVRLRAGTQYQNMSIREDYHINRTAHQWLDSKNFILGTKFLDWFKNVCVQGLNEFGKLKGQPVCYVDDKAYTIRSSSSGPAWTIHIESDGFRLDVDLVPALKFPESRWLGRKYRKIPADCRRDYWLLVPKPNPDAPDTPHEEQRSWRVAVQDQEKQLFNNTYNLRQIIRLIKKFRDAQGMDKLASYYIKTIFFWEIEAVKKLKKKKRDTFWQQDMATLFKHMLQKLYEALEKGNIPYFWNRRKNYIKRWDITTSKEYKSKINDLLNVLKNPSDYKSVAKYLLTTEEYQEYRQLLL